MAVWRRFNGISPGLSPAHLQPSFAQDAVDCFIGKADALYPERKPLTLPDRLVNVSGGSFTGVPRQIWQSGDVWVAWDHWVHVIDDPRAWGSPNAFLYVDQGRIWRTSDEWIKAGKAPRAIGIQRPDSIPTVQVMGAASAPFSVPPAHLPTNSTDTPATCPTGAQAGEARVYVVCCVNDMLEESAPSLPSEIAFIQPEQGVTVSYPGTPPEGTVSYRWYRTLPGKHLSEYRFVAETTLPVLADTYDALSLSDPIETREHFPPMENIQGIARLGSLDVLVWSGTTVWPSISRLPHAFSPASRMDVPYNIVTARSVVPVDPEGGPDTPTATYSSFILTEHQPYMVQPVPPTGDNHPQTTAVIHSINVDEPCLGPQCACSGEGAVTYCSSRGLVQLGVGRSPRAISDELFTLQAWEGWGAGDFTLAYSQGRIFGFADDRTFVMAASYVDKDRVFSLSYSTVRATAAYVERSPWLTVAQSGGTLLRWGEGNGYLTAQWTSRLLTQPEYYNPGAVKVEMVRGPTASSRVRAARKAWEDSQQSLASFLSANPQYADMEEALDLVQNPVTIELYKEGKMWERKMIVDHTPRRLPRQGKGVYWHYKITTNRPVYRVMITKAIRDMATLINPLEEG